MSNITIYRLNTTEFICAELRKINSCTNSAMIAKSVSANIDQKKFYKGNNATAINNNLPRRSPFQKYTLIIGGSLWYIPSGQGSLFCPWPWNIEVRLNLCLLLEVVQPLLPVRTKIMRSYLVAAFLRHLLVCCYYKSAQ